MKIILFSLALLGCTTPKVIERREPKFSYNSNVCVSKGFWKGICGVVKSYNSSDDSFAYVVITTDDTKRLYVEEDYLDFKR